VAGWTTGTAEGKDIVAVFTGDEGGDDFGAMKLVFGAGDVD
jgi:hypothetical protein